MMHIWKPLAAMCGEHLKQYEKANTDIFIIFHYYMSHCSLMQALVMGEKLYWFFKEDKAEGGGNTAFKINYLFGSET